MKHELEKIDQINENAVKMLENLEYIKHAIGHIPDDLEDEDMFDITITGKAVKDILAVINKATQEDDRIANNTEDEDWQKMFGDDGNESIIAILERKRNGQDCTEKESAEIKGWLRDTILVPSNGSVWIERQIQNLFPLEYGEHLDEMDFLDKNLDVE